MKRGLGVSLPRRRSAPKFSFHPNTFEASSKSIRAAPELLSGLTPRQRAVAMKLLEGRSRKVIARQLNITLDTVGDHCKAIYARCNVNSAGELAALVLRGTRFSE